MPIERTPTQPPPEGEGPEGTPPPKGEGLETEEAHRG